MALTHSIRYYLPQPALQPFVSRYMIAYQQLAPSEQIFIRPTPAFPQQSLFFFPRHQVDFSPQGEKPHSGPKELIIGPYTHPVTLSSTYREQLVIRVILQPGALHRLIKIPLHELHNVAFDASSRFGHQIKAINERLAQETAHEKMLSIIEKFLLEKAALAKASLPIDRLFNQIVENPNHYSIDQLADLSCLSLRQFERQFLDRIGLPAKLLIRQARFAQAYGLKRSHPQLSWAAIAYECGYFDQMHFIRDFKAFAASPPGSYFQGLFSRLTRQEKGE